MTPPAAFTLERLINDLAGQRNLRPQLYFKSSLTALSHAMEDQVLAQESCDSGFPLVIASFQEERFYRQEAQRYQRIAQQSDQVYVLAAQDTQFTHSSGDYDCIAFSGDDPLRQEWNLIILGDSYSSCLICQERQSLPVQAEQTSDGQGVTPVAKMDQARQFEGVWTFDRCITIRAANLLLDRILSYRPELAVKVEAGRRQWFENEPELSCEGQVNPAPFADRLVTYLQSGQYKLMRTYRSLAQKERQERLINLISTSIRQSLNPDEVLEVAVQELGRTLGACRTFVYACTDRTEEVQIRHEFLGRPVASLQNQVWPLSCNPLFITIADQLTPLYLHKPLQSHQVQDSELLQTLITNWQIAGWLLLPVLHQGKLLGVLELHHCGSPEQSWSPEDVELAEAVATQLGVAFIQAHSFAHLEHLNRQLAALEQTRDNLTAIVGHELRTPLSTVQVCLESLATEPDMPADLQKVMIDTALSDAERLRCLVQDFLTLSRLEGGRVDWHPDWVSVQECLDMSLSAIEARRRKEAVPSIDIAVESPLPLMQIDGEWVVEVLSKLLDNACKFTPATGQITIRAFQVASAKPTTSSPAPTQGSPQFLQLTVQDTGRGIDPDRLETVFDRFYQEEGALRRTTGGTGLGLAICRQVITRMGGQIWAESQGRDQGATFHFTLPIVTDLAATPIQPTLQESLHPDILPDPPSRNVSTPPTRSDRSKTTKTPSKTRKSVPRRSSRKSDLQ
ncbi:MAG: DICT sensory domain-containing protein [Prochlorotrichaceae cyanobacterium]|jgi:DICT domain-containing protein/signal transduction histidine kinase